MIGLNQAIGRSIRRKEDKANIIIIEAGIKKEIVFSKLSKWIKELDINFVEQNNYNN